MSASASRTRATAARASEQHSSLASAERIVVKLLAFKGAWVSQKIGADEHSEVFYVRNVIHA